LGKGGVISMSNQYEQAEK